MIGPEAKVGTSFSLNFLKGNIKPITISRAMNSAINGQQFSSMKKCTCKDLTFLDRCQKKRILAVTSLSDSSTDHNVHISNKIYELEAQLLNFCSLYMYVLLDTA